MEIFFDPAKSLKNEAERQLPFDKAIDFDWDTAISWDDDRFKYPERRILSIGFLGTRLHLMCFTPISEELVRIISFRKANKREVRFYEKASKEQAINDPRW